MHGLKSSLEEVVTLAEAKESGRRSAERLHDGTSVAASMKSTYKRSNTLKLQQHNSNKQPGDQSVSARFIWIFL